jgi:DNA sulfur modification protein DndD
MILDELVLHNVGPFSSRQRLLLRPPNLAQPVVLIGAKNGSGKTTVLDAIQLALYGRLARCSTRGDESYDEFLRKSTFRGSSASRGSAIELQFTHSSQGKSHTYRIHRSWDVSAAGAVKERLEVVRDGMLDRGLTEQWAEHIEAILPVRLSPFFFFDGEKIEALADPATAPEVLRTALDALLGLDIVDRLRTDLMALERRKRAEALSTRGYAEEIRALEKARGAAEVLQQSRAQELAAARNLQMLTERAVSQLEERYLAEGGLLADNHEALAAELRAAKARQAEVEHQLRDLASDDLPLCLLGDALQGVLSDAQGAVEGEEATLIAKVLSERDKWLLAALSKSGAGSNVVDVIAQSLAADREKRRAVGTPAAPILLDAEGRAIARVLLEHTMPATRESAKRLIELHAELNEEIVKCERLLAAVPSDEALTQLRSERGRVRSEMEVAMASVVRAQSGYDVSQREREASESRLDALLSDKGEAVVDEAETERVLKYSVKARQRLEAFRSAATAAHLGRLEALTREAFSALHRKKDFVQDLRIDSTTMTIQLWGEGHERIDAERLSAGERQLLATAILWALGRASGRTLPVVVDTPLGRLDSDHRGQLVRKYFPNASHQVILLSTDEEVDRGQREALGGSVGREYLLEYDEGAKATKVLSGYFWSEVVA